METWFNAESATMALLLGAYAAGMKFIGIEREQKYFDIACKRIENATRQERLFA